MFSHFYSDPHFFHANIIEYENRPFRGPHHMNETLVHRYNWVVGPRDHVLWLGDCTFAGHALTAELFSRLNGKRSLVLGNHDHGRASMHRLGFELVAAELSLVVCGLEMRACHYPPATYYDSRVDRPKDKREKRRPVLARGERLIHGHVHGKRRLHGKCLNLGVEAWDYAPVPAQCVADAFDTVSRRP